MVNFDIVIDELDETALREFHKKLKESGCYQGLLNINDINETDIKKLKETVKIGVQGAGYERLKEIGPPSIKKEIETIDNKPIIVQEPDQEEQEETGFTSEKKSSTETKEKLIQELIQLYNLKTPGIGVPHEYRERYGEIATILNEKHGMSRLDIQEVTSISDKAVGKAIRQYKERRTIQRPDDRVIVKSESKVAEKLTQKVTKEADDRIEEDMELAIHIRDTYLMDAYSRGISLRELVDTAIPVWFNIEGIYNNMLNMERKTIILKQYIIQLQELNHRLIQRNNNLNQILITKSM